MQAEKILILDFGSQYTELIARRLRELNVYSEVQGYDYPIKDIKEAIKSENLKAIILSGGPNSIYATESIDCDAEIFELGLPVLGICYGMQLMAQKLGGHVSQSKMHEYGLAEIEITNDFSLFHKLQSKSQAWMSHSDHVEKLPQGFEVLAKTSNTPIAAMADSDRRLYAVQFHPEVAHTEQGTEMLSNFVKEVAECKCNWNMHNHLEEAIKKIKATVKDEKVLLALSGGVDSSTLAFLLHKAIGDQLLCVYIDHGFMRANETKELVDIFNNQFHMNIKHVNAQDRFFAVIEGVSDPEQKRKKIGHEFIRTFEEEAKALSKEHGKIKFLAQGTLYPDIIESAGVRIDPKTGKRVAHTIKTHHNVGGLPEDMDFKLLEPLKNLFKDEVRNLARELGVPEKITKRHPFPGPGLAIRVLGEVTREKIKTVAHADLIAREEIEAAGEYDNVWQLVVALLPVKSVGVMGDKRTYANPVVIRAVTSTDAMTADWAKLPYELLSKISNRIVNEVPNVNRAVYDITSKPPGTIEWE